MIEHDALIPAVFVVAAVAFLTFLALMYIIIFMAVVTGGAVLVLAHAAAMTVLASDVLVFAF